jgi:hypothetical protein
LNTLERFEVAGEGSGVEELETVASIHIGERSVICGGMQLAIDKAVV